VRLPIYLDAFAFRFNDRDKFDMMDRVLQNDSLGQWIVTCRDMGDHLDETLKCLPIPILRID